jgi:hypothetical protein
MTATTSEILEAYGKKYNCEDYKNMEGVKAGIEALYKSITGYDYTVQMQAWKKILNDPESNINKSIRMLSVYSKSIDHEKLSGLQAGMQRFADQITEIGTSTLSSLKTEQLFDTDTEIGKGFTDVYDCAYETAKEIEEPDIGKEELKSNVIEEVDNNDANKSIIRSSEFQKVVCIILLIACAYLYQVGGIKNASAITFIDYLMKDIVPSLLVSGMYDSCKAINTGTDKKIKDKQ